MPEIGALAARYGVRIEIADLGEWGWVRLLAEYDPDGRVIRVNARERLDGHELDAAIAHELYHHREAIGEVPRLASRGAREAAADTFARELLGGT